MKIVGNKFVRTKSLWTYWIQSQIELRRIAGKWRLIYYNDYFDTYPNGTLIRQHEYFIPALNCLGTWIKGNRKDVIRKRIKQIEEDLHYSNGKEKRS